MSAAPARRRELVLGGAALLAGAAVPGLAGAQTPAAAQYAVFTEFSPASKLMAPGWNRRVFTDTDSRKGTGIQCDFSSGIITLAPGAYRLTGFSMVAYSGGSEPETTTIRAPASAGYCRLRVHNPAVAVDDANLRAIDNGDPSVICIGSPGTPNMSASLFDAYYETGQTAQILLEHQSGAKPEQIYLRVFAQNSKWHAFARINIGRLG
jgi:hypothetical protein